MQKGFASLVFIIILTLLSASIVAGAIYFKRIYPQIQPKSNNVIVAIPTKSTPVLKSEETLVGQQTIIIQDEYWFSLFIPDGYYLKPGPGDYDIGAIYNNHKIIIRFSGNSTPGGESAPTGSFNIDSIPFTVEYRSDKTLGCPMSMKPSYFGNNLRNNSIYFNLLTWCKDEKEDHDPVYEQIIKSIRFSPRLKEVLIGKRLPPLIKGYIPQMPDICKNIDLNPEVMTFELSYCQGNYCFRYGKNDCNMVDIVKIENGKIVSGQDGKPDCIWDQQANLCSVH